MNLLAFLARAFDTKGYPDDKDPNHWKTINHAHVHLDKNGNYDGGAQKKFNGKHHWGPGYKEKNNSVTNIASILAALAGKKTEEPQMPATTPEPPQMPMAAQPQTQGVTKEDLVNAWEKVNAANSAMNKAKKLSVKKKHAQKMLEAIEEYKKLQAEADPDVAATHKPKLSEKMEKANGIVNQDPLGSLAEATNPFGQSVPYAEETPANPLGKAEKDVNKLKGKLDKLNFWIKQHENGNDYATTAIKGWLDEIDELSDKILKKYPELEDKIQEAIESMDGDEIYHKALSVLNPEEPKEQKSEAEELFEMMGGNKAVGGKMLSTLQELTKAVEQGEDEGYDNELLEKIEKLHDKIKEGGKFLSLDEQKAFTEFVKAKGYGAIWMKAKEIAADNKNATAQKEEKSSFLIYSELSDTQKHEVDKAVDMVEKLGDANYMALYYGNGIAGISEKDKKVISDAMQKLDEQMLNLSPEGKEYFSKFCQENQLLGDIEDAEKITGINTLWAKNVVQGESEAAPPPQPAPKVEPAENPIESLAQATSAPLPFSNYKSDYDELEKNINLLKSPVVQNSPEMKKNTMSKIAQLSKNLTGTNYDNYSFEEKKQLWKAAGSKQNYMDNVKFAAAVANPEGVKYNDLNPLDQYQVDGITSSMDDIDSALNAMKTATNFDDKIEAAEKLQDAVTNMNINKGNLSAMGNVYVGNKNSGLENFDQYIAKAQKAIDLHNKEYDDKIKNDPVFALSQLNASGSTATSVTPPSKKGNTTQQTFKPVSTTVKAKSPLIKKGMDAYHKLISNCGKAWKKTTKAEKMALYKYTKSYSDVNESLRGYVYGKGWSYGYKGAGKIDLDNVGVNESGSYHRKPGEVKKKIQDMTSAIEKSSYDFPMTLRRGCPKGMIETMLGLPQGGITMSNVKSFIGKDFTDHGFASCGVSEGAGFDGSCNMEIYTPAGTKMIYAEPFSGFGNGHQYQDWDGNANQTSTGVENEMILQRGTKFRIDGAEFKGGTLHLKVQVVAQEGYDI